MQGQDNCRPEETHNRTGKQVGNKIITPALLRLMRMLQDRVKVLEDVTLELRSEVDAINKVLEDYL